jgi:hypothetical protein
MLVAEKARVPRRAAYAGRPAPHVTKPTTTPTAAAII